MEDVEGVVDLLPLTARHPRDNVETERASADAQCRWSRVSGTHPASSGPKGRPPRPGRLAARGRAPRGRPGQRPARPTDPPVRQRAGGGVQNRAMADPLSGCGGASAKRPSRWRLKRTSRDPFGEVVAPVLKAKGPRGRVGGEGRAAGWSPALPKPPACSLRIG